MERNYYGSEAEGIFGSDPLYPGITTPQQLFDALLSAWTIDTCAKRYRKQWSLDNITLGQCAITAFLAQDIFGGEVRGIPLEDGGVHCYNVVDGKAFDLTSAQFGEDAAKLKYSDNDIQTREKHFADEDKYGRYMLLCDNLQNLLK